MNTIDLTQGLTDNAEYKAFKFPGGELHFICKTEINPFQLIRIITRINSSDDLMLFILAVDTFRKDDPFVRIEVFIPYMPYQQADRDFNTGESFSLKTIAGIINSLKLNRIEVFDAHSDVTPALINCCRIIDNSEFIKWVLQDLKSNPIWLSPDAGAYKKINKLASKIGYEVEIAAANKYRNINTGNIDTLELSTHDFGGKDILIIDDICMGGNTFIKLAEKLKQHNIGKLYLAVSHMISVDLNVKLNIFDKIFTTNSRHDSYRTKNIDLKVFNIFKTEKQPAIV